MGADGELFQECFTGGHHTEKVQRDVEAAKAAGISGTPAFVVNGVVQFGFQSFEALDALVKAAL